MISLQNVDREHAFGESDQQLLETLAGSLSVALENARLVHETRQRNAELALINSVQEAIAGELDAAGDLRRRRRPDPGRLRRPGRLDRDGRRGDGADPVPVPDRARRAAAGRAAAAGRLREARAGDARAAADRRGRRTPSPSGTEARCVAGERPKSVLFVPLVAGGKATGVISLQNVDREHAFDEDDQRLLTTLAGSLSVALENARLVHETRQRVAELGDGEQRRPGALVAARPRRADRARRRAGARDVRAPTSPTSPCTTRPPGTIEFAYYYESGERRPEPPIEYGEGSRRRSSRSREPLLLNREGAVRGVRTSVGTPSLSYLGVPILVGEQGDRRDQRPEHRGGGPVRRGRLAPARDDRGQRRRRDPERAPVRRGRAADAVLRDRSSRSARPRSS